MLWGLLRNIRLADIADVALVSVLLYMALSCLWRSAGTLLLVGGLLLMAVYVSARQFDMYLTVWILQGLFAIAAIALIILFQEDLRRQLRRFDAWRPTRRRDTSMARATENDVITEAVFSLAANRFGALIVLAGRESLDPHVEGGVALEGRISMPLLCSLFDPHSPGHDGAVLIEDQRVKRFAVHLPLSRNRQLVAHAGTRHSAALGLSERSDALVLVVSEERGSVSICEDGSLEVIASAAELKDRIERWCAHRFPQTDAGPQTWRVWENWRLKATAVALASLAWLVFAYQPDLVERAFVVPIEYRNVPANVLLDGTEPLEARIVLSGREADFSMLDPGSVKISLDLTQAANGRDEFPISGADVRRPLNFALTHVEPRSVRVRLSAAPATSPSPSGG
jgi:uncharacterized protein (TIGR00159 family)